MSSDDAIGAARSFLDVWKEAFNSRQPARISALYAEDALLHGTSAAQLCIGHAQICSYFRGTSIVGFGQRHFVRLSDDNVLVVGNYSFSRIKCGQEVVTPARFTFLVQRRGGNWQILHHHSSAMPS